MFETSNSDFSLSHESHGKSFPRENLKEYGKACSQIRTFCLLFKYSRELLLRRIHPFRIFSIDL